MSLKLSTPMDKLSTADHKLSTLTDLSLHVGMIPAMLYEQ